MWSSRQKHYIQITKLQLLNQPLYSYTQTRVTAQSVTTAHELPVQCAVWRAHVLSTAYELSVVLVVWRMISASQSGRPLAARGPLRFQRGPGLGVSVPDSTGSGVRISKL